MHIFASGAARTNAPGQEIGENTKKMEANRPRPCHLRVASRLRASAHSPRTPENKGTKRAVCTLARNIASRLRASAHFPRTPENKGIKLAVCTLARNIASRLRASTPISRERQEFKGTKRASRVLVRRVASRLRFRKLPRLFCGRRAKVLLRRLRTCRSFRVPSRTGRGSLFHGYAL